jgi:uncharacterized protein
MSVDDAIVAVVAGVVVAAVGTPAGVSGAVFLLPVQLSVLGVTGPAVSATNLLFNIISTPLSLRRLSRRLPVDWTRVGWLVAVGTPAGVAGAFARVTVLADPSRFRMALAAVLLPLGVRLLWRASHHRATPPAAQSGRPRQQDLPTLVGLGAVAAAIGGVLGIGGGSLLAPALVVLGRDTTRRVAALALTTTLTTSVAGLAAYTAFDAADIGAAPAAPYWTTGLALGVGGLIGGLIGAAVQHRVNERLLVAVVGVLSVVTALSYLVLR